MKIDLSEMRRLLESGLGQRAIARLFGCTKSAVQRACRKIGVSRSANANVATVARDIIVGAYLERGVGIWVLAKDFGMHPENVRRHLVKAGVIRSEMQHKPSGLRRRERRRKSQEFLASTKKLRFTQECGICQECGRPINNWMSATYHHIVPCRDGGSREAENCMVLHLECHNAPEVFARLHGGLRYEKLTRGYEASSANG